MRTFNGTFMFVLVLATLWSCVFAGTVSSHRESYSVWCTGNCDEDAVTSSRPGAVLMGGGVSEFLFM